MEICTFASKPLRLATFKPPFCQTSDDYFGPMEISLSRNRTDKMYGAFFTCFYHQSRLLGPGDVSVYRRFSKHNEEVHKPLCRPETINSDNGTNFVGAEKKLLPQIKKMEQTKEIIERTSKRSMTWRFQPPSAPHFGGAQESLVKSTKL